MPAKLRFLIFLISLLIAAWLYMPAVRLGFFWDDVIHLRYVSHTSAEDILTRADLVPYYRPVVNLILKNTQGVPAPIWHMVLLWTHLLNVALVGALASQLGANRGAQGAVMLLFATFPFHYQAVIWVLAWFHPLLTLLILITVNAGLRYAHHPERKSLLMVAWLAGGIAPFVHENGVLAAPLLFILLVYPHPLSYKARGINFPAYSERVQQWILLLAPITFAAILYVLLTQQIVQSERVFATQDLRFNLTYFAQGLSYPFQFITGAFAEDNPQKYHWAWLGIALMIAFLLLTWRRNTSRLRWMGLGWFAISAVLMIAFLREYYVTSAPRLLYLGGVGVALLYGTALNPPSPKRIGSFASGVLLLTLTFASLTFVRDQLRLYLAVDAGYHELNTDLAAHNPATPVLVVNVPLWLEHEERAFPVGNLGAIYNADYYGLSDYVWANTGIEYARLDPISFHDTVDVWPGYRSALRPVYIPDRPTLYSLMPTYDLIYSFSVLDQTRFTARLVGERAAPPTEFLADFASVVRLGSVALEKYADHLAVVRIHWQRLSDAPAPYVAFVHLLCNGAIVDQVDAAPLDNLYDFAGWQVGESWIEYRYLHADQPDCLSVRIGLYDRATGEHPALTDSAGQPLAEPDRFLVIPLSSGE